MLTSSEQQQVRLEVGCGASGLAELRMRLFRKKEVSRSRPHMVTWKQTRLGVSCLAGTAKPVAPKSDRKLWACVIVCCVMWRVVCA